MGPIYSGGGNDMMYIGSDDAGDDDDSDGDESEVMIWKDYMQQPATYCID